LARAIPLLFPRPLRQQSRRLKEHTDGFAFVAPAGGGIGGTVEDEAARLPG